MTEAKRNRGRPVGTTMGGRTRFLTPDQLDALFLAARRINARTEFALRLAAYLGLRCKELVGLRLEDFSPAAKELLVRGVKDGTHRYYRLPPGLWRLYLKYRRTRDKATPASNGWLFVSRLYPETEPAAREWAQKAFKAAAGKAGITGHSIHSLRHTCAQAMAEAGDPQVRIAAWLRHKSIGSSARYISAAQDRNHEAVMIERYSRRGR